MTPKRLGTALMALAVVLVVAWLALRDRAAATGTATRPEAAAPAAKPAPPVPRGARPPAPPRPADDSGAIDGRVIDGASHGGVADAELTFVGDAGVSTFRTSSDGTFEATPPDTGSFALSAITAPGYLPYIPGERRGPSVTLVRGPPVTGVTFTLFAAVDYQGLVVDARGAPVADARVRVLGATGEPSLGAGAEWKTGADGHFTFQAAEDAVLEASRGSARGWAHVGRDVAVIRWLTIRLGRAPGDTTITGHVRDRSGAPIADALVRAAPSLLVRGIALDFATTGADGAFTIAGVDHGSYEVSTEVEDHLRAVRYNVLGGSRDVDLVVDSGAMLTGRVVDAAGAPVPSYTLLVMRLSGAARPILVDRALIDPQGRFAVRVPHGDYDVLAVAHGCARSTPTRATAGAGEVRIALGGGATLRGRVVASGDHAPIGDARITCEIARSRRDALPADAGTVTRADGSFELRELSSGPLAIRVRANGYHDRIEAVPPLDDGAAGSRAGSRAESRAGSLAIELHAIDPDDLGHTETVGIGADLNPDGDTLRITRVLPGSGAFDAGLGFGDRITAIDGIAVTVLGVENAIARLRGAPGTRVTLTLRRDGRDVQVVIDRRLLRA